MGETTSTVTDCRHSFVPEQTGLKGDDVSAPFLRIRALILHYWPRVFRGAILCSALILLTLQSLHLSGISFRLSLLLLLMIAATRLFPVALAREKPIYFTSAFVFAASILQNGAVAGWIALAVCLLHAHLMRHKERLEASYTGAIYALAAMLADWLYRHLLHGEPTTEHIGIRELSFIILSAVAYMLSILLMMVAGNLGTRQAHREYYEPVLRVQGLAYAISFPFVIVMIVSYRGFGAVMLPVLAGMLIVCAYSVRASVENRIMARQLAAAETLGRACEQEVRVEIPLVLFLGQARELVLFQHAILWIMEEEGGEYKPMAVYPEGSDYLKTLPAEMDALISRVGNRTSPLIVSEAAQDPRTPAGSPEESWMLYPLRLHGSTMGVALFSRDTLHPFTRQDARRLAGLIPQAAIAFESVRLRQMIFRYSNMAITDGLTGLLNHRRSQEVLREEFRRATRYCRPLSVLMLDVDGFKEFNDTYGHPQGDQVLAHIARLLRTSVRSVDHVGRYGGEEFIIILPETTRENAFALAERIRATVALEWFPAGNGEFVQKTVSIGVSAYPDDAVDPADLIQLADEALYRAKRSGKNRVLSA
jgi:diguanylate cyclase (GGDEF)-like protein